MDFNDAPEQMEYTLIPSGTFAKVRMEIKKSFEEDNVWVTTSKSGESRYLDCVFEIAEGEYANRKVFDKIGVNGSKDFVNMGKGRIRAMLESARNISRNDMSDKAKAARDIDSFERLDGLVFAVKIGVSKDKNGQYQDKNRIDKIITPDDREYAQIMGSPIISGASVGSSPVAEVTADDSIPF